jgi:hypothetical protein
MNAHSTNAIHDTEVSVSERAHKAIEDSGETIEQILKSHMPFPTFAELSSIVGHTLKSGEILMIGSDSDNNTVSILHFSEFAADLIQREFGWPALKERLWSLHQGPLGRRNNRPWKRLVGELSRNYDVSKNQGRVWVDNDELALFLDGLDKVREEVRGACVRVINTFREFRASPERIFLRKVGGGYIFIHRLLMEYFADLYTESSDRQV